MSTRSQRHKQEVHGVTAPVVMLEDNGRKSSATEKGKRNMTTYKTKVADIGGVTVTVSKAGKTASERLAALLEALGTDIENSLPEGGGSTDPGYGKPEGSGGARPDNTLPGGPTTKPGTPTRPDQSLPLEELAEFLKDNAKEIAGEVLKGTLCDPAAAPKR